MSQRIRGRESTECLLLGLFTLQSDSCMVGTPRDWRETAMLQAATTLLLMGAAAMSNLLMSPTRATSRSRHTASTSTSSS